MSRLRLDEGPRHRAKARPTKAARIRQRRLARGAVDPCLRAVDLRARLIERYVEIEQVSA